MKTTNTTRPIVITTMMIMYTAGKAAPVGEGEKVGEGEREEWIGKAAPVGEGEKVGKWEKERGRNEKERLHM